jgi:ABC-type multidrug transport system fused ATPase/permease subunit
MMGLMILARGFAITSIEIFFKNVEFAHHTIPEQLVLKRVNIEILKNKKTAFVALEKHTCGFNGQIL